MKDEIQSDKNCLKNIYFVLKLVRIIKNWNEMNHYSEFVTTIGKSNDKEDSAEENEFLPTISECWNGEVLSVHFSLLL